MQHAWLNYCDMDRILTFIIGAIFTGGGGLLTYQAFEDDKNTIESMLFGFLGVAAGLFLLYVAIMGPPDL
jgi:uncharacterized membrane protein HdeD (DUF308 family)